MSVEYRAKLIRRAVDANTSPNVSPTPLQVRTLHKYFESPLCADIAYMKIIERGEWAVSGLTQPGAQQASGEGMLNQFSSSSGTLYNPLFQGTSLGESAVGGLDGSSGSMGTVTNTFLGKMGATMPGNRSSGVGDGGDKVLLKCVRLLKTYLFVYYPSDSVLIALDRFCFRMQQIFPEGAKSFEYIRSMVDSISHRRHPSHNISSTSNFAQQPSNSVSPASNFGTGVYSSTQTTIQNPSSILSSPSPSPKVDDITSNSAKNTNSTYHSTNYRTNLVISNFIMTRLLKTISPRNELVLPLSETLLSSSVLSGQIPRVLLSALSDNTDDYPVQSSGTVKSGKVSRMSISSQTSSSSPANPTKSSSQSIATPPSSNITIKLPEKYNHTVRSMLFVLNDQDIKDRIATVSMSKKTEERAMYKSFRRGQPLFQYKHYKEQVKLSLSANQIEMVVNSMIQSTSHESRLVASKIMIKLIMDMYCNDSIEMASSSLLSLLMEMIQPSQTFETKVHAFNLIFNISTHMNMFEEVSFFGNPNTMSSKNSVPTNSSSSTNRHLEGSTTTITKIQNELYSITKELLLGLVHNQETSRKLWFSGLSILLYFITDSGYIDKNKFDNLDIRVIASFFRHLEYINDSVWRILVRLLCNRLYYDRKNPGKRLASPNNEFILQIQRLSLVDASIVNSASDYDCPLPSSGKDGIKFIIDLYKRSRSMEARDNLWHVIFDYIHFCYRRMLKQPKSSSDSESDQHISHGKKGSSSLYRNSSEFQSDTQTSHEFNLILEILTRIEAPQYFASLFKYPPTNFVNHVSSIINHIASVNVEFRVILDQVDPILLRRVLRDFSSLAELSLRLSAPFNQDCAAMIADAVAGNSTNLTARLKNLSQLLHGTNTGTQTSPSSPTLNNKSNDPFGMERSFERFHGRQWLIQLMQLVWNKKLGLNQLAATQLKNVSIYSGNNSKEPSPRKSRISVTSKDVASNSNTAVAGSINTAANTSNNPTTTSTSTGKRISKDIKEIKESKDSNASNLPSGKNSNTSNSSSSSHNIAKESQKKLQPTIQLPTTPSSAINLNPPALASSNLLSPSSERVSGLHTRIGDPAFTEAVEQTFYGLLKSPDPAIRQTFLKVTEAGIYYIFNLSDQGNTVLTSSSGELSTTPGSTPRNQCTVAVQDRDALLKKAFELVNMNFNKIISVSGETNEGNLQIMFDIIFELVQIVPSAHRESSTQLSSFSMLNSDYFSSKSTEPSSSSTLGSSKELSRSDKSEQGRSKIKYNTASQITQNLNQQSSRPLQSKTLQTPLKRSPANSVSTNNPNSTLSPNAANTIGKLPVSTSNSSDDERDYDKEYRVDDPANHDDNKVHDNDYDNDEEEPWGMGSLKSNQPEIRSQASPTSISDMNSSMNWNSEHPDKVGINSIDLSAQDDSPAGFFMRGNLQVVQSALDLIDIQIILHIFLHLPPRMNSSTRPVALHFLTQKCKENPKDLEAVGGSSFFKKLLTENDPLISYLASRFLIDKLQKEQPENFNTVVNTLLAKAVDLNDEKLVSNPYLQIKAIFEMNNILRRKEFPL